MQSHNQKRQKRVGDLHGEVSEAENGKDDSRQASGERKP